MSCFTKALLDVIEETCGAVSNLDLINRVNSVFAANKKTQRVGLVLQWRTSKTFIFEPLSFEFCCCCVNVLNVSLYLGTLK
jgi:hypothetical protein